MLSHVTRWPTVPRRLTCLLLLLLLPACLACRRDKLWRGVGVAIPVFSLRTKQSVGVGEFLDILKLVDFADTCGMRLVQILPVRGQGQGAGTAGEGAEGGHCW